MGRFNPLLLAVVMALLLFATFPGGLVPINDGFGYIRSIALTYQHGRPWTDDWLEPWAAGFSTLGALVFAGTGSMYLATYGVCAALMGVTAWACSRLLAARQVPVPVAAAVTVMLLLFPTVLWKYVEVSGFSLYFACLFLALLSYERGNWPGFTLAWCVALSTRQSAVAWGVLPAYALAGALWRRESSGPRNALRPLVSILVAAGVFLWLAGGMNQTHAQTVITSHTLARWSLPVAVNALEVALWTFGVAFGLGRLVMGACPREGTGLVRRGLAAGAAALVVAASLGWDLRAKLAYDHDAFAVPAFYVYLKGLCLLGGVGLGLSALRVRLDFLLAALGATAVLLLRSATWDYYLADVCVFAFLGAETGGRETETFRGRAYVCGALAALSLSFLVFFKMRCDREYLVDTLGARALARGAIDWTDASFLPFGATGWYFFPYYATHEGRTSADLGDFGRYLRQDVYGVAERYPRILRTFPQFRGTLPSDRSTIVEQARFSYCWFFHVDAALVRLPAAQVRPALTPVARDAGPPALPLTDAAWRAELRR